MKKLLSTILLLTSVGGSYAMHTEPESKTVNPGYHELSGDGLGNVITGISQLDIESKHSDAQEKSRWTQQLLKKKYAGNTDVAMTDQKTQEPDGRYEELQEKYAQSYATKQYLIAAMVDADSEIIKQCEKFWPWPNYKSLLLKKSDQARINKEFGDQFASYSAIWIALELVINSKNEEEERPETYQKRLDILKIVASNTNLWEQLPLRSYGWMCNFVCMPCASFNAKGWPPSRAAQANNVDALKILLECVDKSNETKVCCMTCQDLLDSDGSSLFDYAARSDAQDVMAFIATREVGCEHKKALQKGLCAGVCSTLTCLTCCYGGDTTKKIVHEIT